MNTFPLLRRPILAVLIGFMLGTPWLGAQTLDHDLGGWREIKGEHFVVYVQNPSDVNLGKDTLRAAETYYDKIARQIGYARYGNIWTWDERVKIIIFPDQVSFSVITNQPLWSRGYAVRDRRVFDSRAIVTYKQEEGFTTKVLPHEIGHLILKDFLGPNHTAPLWFDEGVAQLQEVQDPDAASGMKFVVENRQSIPFNLMQTLDIRQEKDGRKVAIFYAQSRMVLEYLIRFYGQDAFRRLCRELKEGAAFDEAFKTAYAPAFENFIELEPKWLEFMTRD